MGRGQNLQSAFHGTYSFSVGLSRNQVEAKFFHAKTVRASGYKHKFFCDDSGQFQMKVTTDWAADERTSEMREKNAIEAYERFRSLPIEEDKIFFESMSTRYFNDNPRAIYEELCKRGGKWKLVWGLKNCKTDIGPGGTVAMYNSLEYWRHMATAKYIVSNINQYQLVKRPGQIVINTMHGIPLKHMGLDAVKSPRTREKMIRVFTKDWDIFVSPCDYMTKIIRDEESYGFKGKMLELGYPRNDVLVKNVDNEELRVSVRAKLGVPDGKKLILYAPTFRSKKRLDVPLDFTMMKEALADEYCLAFRAHYLVKQFIDPGIYDGFVLDGNIIENTNDLLVGADVLITDYSSIMFDFSIFKRPMVFYIPDWEKYAKSRGTYFDLPAEYPVLCASTMEEVVAHFRAFDSIEDAIFAFAERFNQYETGHAAKDVVDAIWGDQ